MASWLQKQVNGWKAYWSEVNSREDELQKRLAQSRLVQGVKKYVDTLEGQPVSKEEEEERKKYYPLWMHYGGLFIEPLLLGFTILLFFTRLQDLITESTNFPNFYERLNSDMLNSPVLYFGFVLVFLVWVVFKTASKLKEYKRDKETQKSNDEIITTLKAILAEIKQDKQTDKTEGGEK